MTNQHTLAKLPKTPKRTTDAKAGRKGRGQRAKAERSWMKKHSDARKPGAVE